jgi:hypothetical protein
MLIPELYSSNLALQPQTAGSALRAWTTGQILQATVVRQALDGTVTLRVGNQEVQARTGLNLAADQALTLQVAQSGTQTVLRILHVSDTAPAPHPTTLTQTAAPTPEATLTQAWRQVLPREGDLRPLLAQLASMAAGTQPEALPGSVVAALKQFASRLPLLETLATPTGLKRAVNDSGLFLEARLAQALTDNTPPALQNDLKANLLQLVIQLRALVTPPPSTSGAAVTTATTGQSTDPALPALLQQADAALARIEQNQLATLSGSPHATTLLAVDLPMRDSQHVGVLELSIEEQATGATGRETVMPWSVWLHFDFEQLGKVHARITLRGEEVSAALWAERETTTALFQQHLATLEGALRHAGLVPAAVHCQTGTPPRAEEAAPPSSLLDERA